jgi:hypothetical protein
MDEPVELDLTGRLEDVAHALRAGDADVRWLLEMLAARLESILPDQVEVERVGVVRRHVRGLVLRTPTLHLECRLAPGGGLATSIAEVQRGIAGRAREVPPARWAEALEGVMLAELARSDAERKALDRLVP